MTQSAIATAETMARLSEMTPNGCSDAMENNNDVEVQVDADGSDVGKVVTAFTGETVAIAINGLASLSPPRKTLCFQTSSGMASGNGDVSIGTLVYGAMSPGTVFIAVHDPHGNESVVELTIRRAPPRSGIALPEIILLATGPFVLIVGLVGLFNQWVRKRHRHDIAPR
jgi:hypothetical protein